MVKGLNNIKFLEKNSTKYQYLIQIQEAIKLDFIHALIDSNQIEKAVKLKFLELQRIKKKIDSKEKDWEIFNFYQKAKENKQIFLQILELESKFQEILRRSRKSALNDIISCYKNEAKDEQFSFIELLKKAFENKIKPEILQDFLIKNFKAFFSLTAHPTNPTSLEFTRLGYEFDEIISDKKTLNFKDLQDILKKIILCSATSQKKSCLDEMIESELAIKNIKIANKELHKKLKLEIANSPYKNQIFLPEKICETSLWSHGGDGDGNPNINAEILKIGIERIKKFRLESTIDLRHDAQDIENAVAEILQNFAVKFFLKNDEKNKIKILHEFLENEILIDKINQFLIKNTNNNEIVKRLLVVNKDPLLIDKFIISNHQNVSQVLMVLFLLKITKNFQIKNHVIDIVTLSESVEDLKNIFAIQQQLIANKFYQKYLQRAKKIIAMIAKSDTARVGGIAVDYYQDRATGQILMLKKIALEKHNLDLDIYVFNGGGYALQRGGGRFDEIITRQLNSAWEVAEEIGVDEINLKPAITTIQGQQQQILFGSLSISQNTIENFALHNLCASLKASGFIEGDKICNAKYYKIRQEFCDEAINSYQKKYFSNQYFNELFFNSNRLGVMLGNLSSRPLKRGSSQKNILTPHKYCDLLEDILTFNIFTTRAITLDRTIAHTGTFAIMFLGLCESFNKIITKYNSKILLDLYFCNKPFRDFIRNQIIALNMVDINYAWKMLIGIDRPKAEDIIQLSKIFADEKKMQTFSLKKRQKITMAFLDFYIFEVAKNIAKSIFNQDLELDYERYDLNKILEIYSANLANEMQYCKNESVFTKLCESDWTSFLNDNRENVLDDLDFKIIHNSYIANNIIFNAPLTMATIFTSFKKDSHEVHNFLEKISDKSLYF
jgi:phosphoenolpyruvate carboxylase